MGYYDDPLPPRWYTKIERFITFNWMFIFMAALAIGSLYLIFFGEESRCEEPYGCEEYDRTAR